MPEMTVVTPGASALNGVATPPAATEAPKAPETPKDAPETPKVEAKPADDTAKRFEAISKREAEAQKKIQAFQAEREAFKKREAEVAQYADLKARAKTVPLKVLEAFGLTHEDVTNALLAEKEAPGVSKIREEFEAERKARQDLENRLKAEAEAREQSAKEEAITAFRGQVTDFVKANADKYELVSLVGPEAVISHIKKVYDESLKADGEGKILEYDEACAAVEAEYEQEIEKVLATKKFSSRYTKAEAKAAAEAALVAEKTEPAKAAVKTLTNTMAAPTSAGAKDDKLPISKDDRIRAIAQKLGG